MNNKLFKKIIGIFGYKLVDKSVIRNDRLLGSQSFLNINLILNKIFKNYNINYLIQIGANDGIRFDELNNYPLDQLLSERHNKIQSYGEFEE